MTNDITSMFNLNPSNAAPQTAATPDVSSLATLEGAPVYEAPAIESIFSSGDLQRELLYAAPGTLASGGDPPDPPGGFGL